MQVQRATRHNLQLPIRYRRAGEASWRLALTRNVSSSGVLFDSEEVLDLGIEVNLLLAFSREWNVQSLAEVEFASRVVRVRPPQPPDGHAAIAAQFLS